MASRSDTNSTHASSSGFMENRKRRILSVTNSTATKAEPYEVSATFPVVDSQQPLYFPAQQQQRESGGSNNDADRNDDDDDDDDDDTSESDAEGRNAAVSSSRTASKNKKSSKSSPNASSSTLSGTATTANPVLKRAVRLSKNREAARECRKKKKEYVKCLESRVAVLENQNKALMDELRLLKELYCKSMSDLNASGGSSGYNTSARGGKNNRQRPGTTNLTDASSSTLSEGSLSQKLKTIQAKNSPISGLNGGAETRTVALPVIGGSGGTRILLVQAPNAYPTPMYAVPPTSSS